MTQRLAQMRSRAVQGPRCTPHSRQAAGPGHTSASGSKLMRGGGVGSG
jgi:hypothetical protein